MAAVHQPTTTFADYDAMLADDNVDAVIVAVADQFHVPLSIKALEAGKHVLVEKPMATTVEDASALLDTARTHDRVVLVGHEKRYDPGVAFAHDFIREEIGELIGLEALVLRLHLPLQASPTPCSRSSSPAPPPADLPATPKPTGSATSSSATAATCSTQPVTSAALEAIRARLSTKADTYCWFLEVAYANGCLGQLDLTIAVRMDWWEGFQVYGSEAA